MQLPFRVIIEDEKYQFGDKAKAYAAYEAALRSSLSQSSIFNSSVALNATQVNAYMARPKVMMGADKLTMKDIIAQKYIFLFLFQSQEAYNDIRRTSLISLNDPDGTAKRFAYPIEEITRNANAPQASDRETIYQNNARLFWAKL